MLTVTLLLYVTAFICTILAAIGKCPLWIAVLLVVIAGLLDRLPK